MLILTQREDEKIDISLREDIDPSTPVGDLFNGSQITLTFLDTSPSSVTLGIDAPDQMLILRRRIKDREQK